MKLTKARLKKLSDNLFLTELGSDSFVATKKEMIYYQIAGDFLKVISVSTGRSLGTLYLHVYTNLITDPWCKFFSDYTIGNRFEFNPITKNTWICENAEINEVEAILRDMLDFIKVQGLNKLNEINDYQTYFVESYSVVNPKLFQLDFAISMCKLGKFDKAYWICDDLLNYLKSDAYLESSKKEGMLKNVLDLQKAADKNDVDNLLNEWKKQSLAYIAAQ